MPELAPGEELPNRCVLNLHEHDHVVASAAAESDVSWVAVRTPKTVIGRLEDEFQGAWFDGSHHLHFQMGHAAESYGISPGHSTGYILGLLAAITVARQSGFSHREVVSALRPLLESEAAPSVMPAPTIENREVPVLIAA